MRFIVEPGHLAPAGARCVSPESSAIVAINASSSCELDQWKLSDRVRLGGPASGLPMQLQRLVKLARTKGYAMPYFDRIYSLSVYLLDRRRWEKRLPKSRALTINEIGQK